MKVVLRGSSPLFSALGIPCVASHANTAPILKNGRAGDVYIGMPALDVLAAFAGRAKFNELNTRADIFCSPSQRRHPDLTLDITDGVVTAIHVYARRYKTETGVGPGDSLIALATAHEIHWTDEDNATVHGLNMKFQFEKDRIISVLLS